MNETNKSYYRPSHNTETVPQQYAGVQCIRWYWPRFLLLARQSNKCRIVVVQPSDPSRPDWFRDRPKLLICRCVPKHCLKLHSDYAQWRTLTQFANPTFWIWWFCASVSVILRSNERTIRTRLDFCVLYARRRTSTLVGYMWLWVLSLIMLSSNTAATRVMWV